MKHSFILMLIIGSGLCACSNNASNEVAADKPEIIDEDYSSENDAELQANIAKWQKEMLERNNTPENRDKIEANEKLLPYLVIEGNQFRLDISEEDAKKLGVSSKHYREAIKSIDSTNQAIREDEAQGIPTDLDGTRQKIEIAKRQPSPQSNRPEIPATEKR